MGTRAEVLAKVLDALDSYCSFVGHLSERTNDLLLGPSSILSYQMANVAATEKTMFFRICTKT